MKRFLKIPMVALIINVAMLSGFNIACFKLAGIAGKERPEFFAFTACALIGALGQILFLNFVMSLYRQVEVGPIYQSLLIVFNVTSGLLIFNEIRFYPGLELGCLFTGFGLCIAGVIFIGVKSQS